MAVVFDAAGHLVKWGTTTTSIDVPITIGPGTNRAIMLWLLLADVTTSLSVFGAGATGWAAVSGTDTGDTVAGRSLIWVGKNPASGAQTVSATWNNLSHVVAGVIAVSGVDQTTPALNGTFHASYPVSLSTEDLTVTTGDGHMVVDGVFEDSGVVVLTNGQDQAWASNNEDGSSRWASGAYKAFVGAGAFDMSYSAPAGAFWMHSAMDFQPAAAVQAAFAFSDTMMPQYQIKTTRVIV